MEDYIKQIINIAHDVYNEIGPGYNEVMYHRGLEVGLRNFNISYQSEVVTPVYYKSHVIGHGRVDLIVNYSVIIELKAIANLNNMDSIIQIKNYMKEHRIDHGLIINFVQPNKTNGGGLNIKYVHFIKYNNEFKIYHYINDSFVDDNLNVIVIQ